jgi:hypothetical protein
VGVPKEIPWPEAEGGVIKSTNASKEKREISVSPEEGARRTDARHTFNRSGGSDQMCLRVIVPLD